VLTIILQKCSKSMPFRTIPHFQSLCSGQVGGNGFTALNFFSGNQVCSRSFESNVFQRRSWSLPVRARFLRQGSLPTWCRGLDGDFIIAGLVGG